MELTSLAQVLCLRAAPYCRGLRKRDMWDGWVQPKNALLYMIKLSRPAPVDGNIISHSRSTHWQYTHFVNRYAEGRSIVWLTTGSGKSVHGKALSQVEDNSSASGRTRACTNTLVGILSVHQVSGTIRSQPLHDQCHILRTVHANCQAQYHCHGETCHHLRHVPVSRRSCPCFTRIRFCVLHLILYDDEKNFMRGYNPGALG